MSVFSDSKWGLWTLCARKWESPAIKGSISFPGPYSILPPAAAKKGESPAAPEPLFPGSTHSATWNCDD